MRLIIFDIDGTLLDSQHQILCAQQRAFGALGLPAPTREASLSIVGLSLHEAFAELVGVDGPIEELCGAYKAAWLELLSSPDYREVLYSGASELIRDLACEPGVLLGIATGKSRRGVDRIIAAQRWDGMFATIQTADTHPSKPHPSMVLEALTETGVAAVDAVMIGDTRFDMEMASGAGVRAIGVDWGYHPRSALIEAGATVAGDFGDLRGLLGLATRAAA